MIVRLKTFARLRAIIAPVQSTDAPTQAHDLWIRLDPRAAPLRP
ncbi:MAG: hypothetical protein QM770_19805 [Tepidisphaeraceae bacterium]